MKEFLQKLIDAKKAEINAKREAIKNAATADEVRSLGDTLDGLKADLEELEKKLAEVEEAPAEPDGERGFNPMGTFEMRNGKGTKGTEHPRSTMEYRKAFMQYVQTGVRTDALNVRAEGEVVSSNLGVLLPNTIINEIIKGVEKVYGQIYSRVKHTNVKGGVQYPVGAFSANFYWNGTDGTDSEHGVSEKQEVGGVTGYVTFSYHIGEIRIAQSLLETILTVEAFEKEIVNALVEAYVKAMDVAIFEGTGAGQPIGIFSTAGLAKISNVIEFTATEMEDWKQWKKKLFAKIPLSMRKLSPEFVMTANTWESNIETLEDSAGQPIAREIYNQVNGAETCRFNGKEVVLVEEGNVIKNFEDAAAGEYFGIYWVPEKAYAINSNLQFGYKTYFDENTNQKITKALVIVDGQILDAKYIYLLKKKA